MVSSSISYSASLQLILTGFPGTARAARLRCFPTLSLLSLLISALAGSSGNLLSHRGVPWTPLWQRPALTRDFRGQGAQVAFPSAHLQLPTLQMLTQ